MTAAKQRAEPKRDPELAERADRIAEAAEDVARVVVGLAGLVRKHADEIAGWTLRARRTMRS